MSRRFDKLAVGILTTEGPSYIQNIADEHPEVRSVICLNGTSNALPISADYDAFVREPTGIVQRAVGHPVFRMDVSDPIDDGQSWQLGAFLAHLLSYQSEFADHTTADAIVFATGQVDRDLVVHAVDHVPNKLSSARQRMEAALSAGKQVILVAPSENLLNVDDGQLPPEVEVIPAETISQIMGQLDGRSMAALAPAEHPANRKSGVYLKAGLLAVLGIAAAAFAFENEVTGFFKNTGAQVSEPVAAAKSPAEKPEKIAALSPEQTDKKISRQRTRELSPDDIEGRLMVLNPREGLSCAGSGGDLVQENLSPGMDTVTGACGLAIRVTNRSDNTVRFGALIFADGSFREYSRSGNYIASKSGMLKPQQSDDINLRKPAWLKRAFDYRVLIVVFDGEDAIIENRINQLTAEIAGGAGGELAGRLGNPAWSMSRTIRYAPK